MDPLDDRGVTTSGTFGSVHLGIGGLPTDANPMKPCFSVGMFFRRYVVDVRSVRTIGAAGTTGLFFRHQCIALLIDHPDDFLSRTGFDLQRGLVAGVKQLLSIHYRFSQIVCI